MPETVTNPPALYEPAARPSSEIGWSRPGTADRGLSRLGGAINSMLGTHFGMLVHDVFNPADLALTPSDPLDVAGVHRRWMVKTPSYLDITSASNRQFTIQVRVAKAAGAGLSYRLYVNGVLNLNYNFSSGGLTEQWVTITTTVPFVDTVEYQEIRLERSGWHGGAAASDYCRAVRIFPNVWASIADKSDGWRFLQTPVPVSAFGNNDSAASFMLQAMQRNLRWLYERRVPTLYASTGEHVNAGTTLEDWTRVRLDYPAGVEQVRFWFYAYGPSPSASIQVNGYSASVGTGSVKTPDPAGWASVTCDVSPRGSPAFRLATRESAIYSVCAYCQDAVYGV